MRLPTPEEKRKFHRWGVELVGFDKLEGWKNELPFYRFKCEEHGQVVNYKAGHNQILCCPECLKKQTTTDPKTL